MTFILREANPSDADVLSSIAMRAKAHWAYSADFMAAVAAELRVSSTQLQSSDWLCQVAVQDLCIVGYALVDASKAQQWVLEAMFVLPEVMGLGVGKQLMTWVKTSMRRLQCPELMIPSDPYAEAFYVKMGATKIGETPSDSIVGRMLPLMKLKV
ncbi:GNAT family N-acetyltransferase [Bowmanella sp. Y26]|uniref:GNAT family N-acetyltransferase n=1 Tax=Bowmanella yangjiangensis TaxID=2811230 RepID=UPI001BDBDE4B|nr:GNAT family N-acetyltransferase [Bowmanella yangjiangensis]MBT1062029.1 GNAT family N-acetyltransferase [Bowmanella yangjiangensis]